MSRVYKVDDISHLVSSLSKYFRLNLSSGNDIVKISEVVELIGYYLDIQKIRYKNKLSVDIQVDDSIRHCRVLKYLFQPIVENAVYHGIEKKKGNGYINICFNKVGNRIRFQVTDNGAGIPNQKLEKIMKCLEKDDLPTGDNFALQNINSQMRIFYDNDYSINISSIEGEGTTVTLEIPILDKMEMKQSV
jgi:two-component system sensor histidine kinase YesM